VENAVKIKEEDQGGIPFRAWLFVHLHPLLLP